MTTGASRRLRVTFWGPLTDAVAVPEREIVVAAGTTPREIAKGLSEEDGALGEALSGKGVLVMADDMLIDWTTDVSTMRELAFMAPMSGG